MVEWIFAQLWEYTKLTFRILGFIFRWLIYGTNYVLNRRQATKAAAQGDLFTNDKR